VIELATALLLILSPWSARAGLVGGAVASLTFFVTTTIMFAAPMGNGSGGFPWLNEVGQFLIKDVALLGVALMVFGESFAKMRKAHAPSKASALASAAETSRSH
jgi:reactive chlorine resistance protein C